MCNNIKWIVRVYIWLVLMSAVSIAANGMDIVYPRGESEKDERSSYSIHLLAVALEKAGVEYALKPSRNTMQQGRALLQLALGVDVDVVPSVTSKEREAALLPIRIPLDKGLGGWRIFLIHKKNRSEFERVRTLEGLKSFTAGQGHDWPDTKILRANGLNVYGSPAYESLFNMLQYGRIDYFPRSLHEIWAEHKNHSGLDIEVEGSIVLQYPTALYYFVNKNNRELAAVLERGLRAAIRDGSFDKVFYQHYGEPIRLSNFKNRRVFKLQNPLLPEATPLEQKALWFR